MLKPLYRLICHGKAGDHGEVVFNRGIL